jgi:hypothetical protein
MNKTKNFLYIGLILLIGFTACNTEEMDTEIPVITINEPHDHEHFHPGGKIHFDADFSDNVGLKQFKIDIHSGEGHTHKSNGIRLQDNEWSYVYTGDLEGRNKHVHMDITIPEDAKHGEYHFIVYCTDQAGNESFVALEFEVEDDGDHHHDH